MKLLQHIFAQVPHSARQLPGAGKQVGQQPGFAATENMRGQAANRHRRNDITGIVVDWGGQRRQAFGDVVLGQGPATGSNRVQFRPQRARIESHFEASVARNRPQV